MTESIASTSPVPAADSLEALAFGVLEVREKILDHLVNLDDRQAIVNMALSFKQLYEEVVNAVKRRDVGLLRPMRQFISGVVQALAPNNPVSTALKTLPFLPNPRAIGTTFYTAKQYIRNYKRLIIQELKSLSTARLKSLKKEIAPLPPCENMFSLASIEQRIDQAMAIGEEEESYVKAQTLTNIVSSLLESGDIDRAIEIAEQIPDYDTEYKSIALEKIFSALLEQGAIERAFALVEKIRSSSDKLRALEKIVLAKIKEEDVKKVVEIVEHIPHEESHRLKIVVFVRLKQGDVNGALAIAKQIPRETKSETFEPGDQESQTLRKIVFALVKKGDIDKAAAAANQIPDEEQKISVLERIVSKLLEKDEFDKAIRIAWQIPENSDNNTLSMTLQEIVSALLQKNKCDKALEIAMRIPDDQLRPMAIEQVRAFIMSKGVLLELPELLI